MSKSPLRLAIDGNEANVVNRVGSNVYAYEVISALEKLPAVRESAEVTVLLSQPPVTDLPKERQGWSYQVIGPKPLWTQLGLPWFLWWHPQLFDVLYTPGHYAPRWSPIPYISSVMDLAYLYFPEQFRHSDLVQLRDWTAYSVRHAHKVVAISEATKSAIQEKYGRIAEDIVIGYPALAPLVPDLTIKEGRALEKKLDLHEPYLIYVGTIQPRKNLVRLIHAFERLHEDWSDRKQQAPQLVIAGKVGWLADETMAAIDTSPVKAQIKLTGYISEAEKQYLLQHAAASVLIGLYEGFGIPPLESLRLGTIPVVSNTTSLPEVVGEAGILVDPEDVQSIADGLARAVKLTSRERAALRKAGREQIKKFSWQETATVVWEAMVSIYV